MMPIKSLNTTVFRAASWLRRSRQPSAAPPAGTRQTEDALPSIAAHLEYLGYELAPPEPDGWCYAQHPARYNFHLRSFPWGIRLHCAVWIDASAAKSRDAWMAYLNTANEKSRLTQFSLFEDESGAYAVKMRAFASGPYSRQVFAMVMDMWHDDLDLIRRKREFAAVETHVGLREAASASIH
jgi:hypothetical protein